MSCFYCYEDENEILGVMGIQDKGDVALIQHAYIRTKKRNAGIGTKLLKYFQTNQDKTILIGTWKDAIWAINFYLKNGFELVANEEEMRQYWTIPGKQVETSIVLIG